MEMKDIDMIRKKTNFLEQNSKLLFHFLYRKIGDKLLIDYIQEMLLSDNENELLFLNEYITKFKQENKVYVLGQALAYQIICKIIVRDPENKERYREYVERCKNRTIRVKVSDSNNKNNGEPVVIRRK